MQQNFHPTDIDFIQLHTLYHNAAHFCNYCIIDTLFQYIPVDLTL